MEFYINEEVLAKILKYPEHREIAIRHLITLHEYPAYVMLFDLKMSQLESERKELSAAEYQEERGKIDDGRSARHNSAIASLSTLNKLAERFNLPPVYEGEISEDGGPRKEIARAVFELGKNTLDHDSEHGKLGARK